MPRPLSKKDIDILEERGYWKASSSLRKRVKRLIRKNMPLQISYINDAHRIIFMTANQSGMAGRYRRDNPELKRVDGTLLKLSHWQKIPSEMADLDFELREETKNIKKPEKEQEYQKTILVTAKLSHRLAVIHPFENGNGRASRLLLNAILWRAGLPAAVIKNKRQYLKAMRQADDGDFSLLEHIVLDGLLENRRKLYETIRRKQAELKKLHRKRRRY